MDKPASLRDLIHHYFARAEIRGLCLDLNIEYEDLPGETRTEIAQSLVERCLRQGRLPDLVQRCRQLRGHVNWPDGEAIAAEWDKVQQGIAAQENLAGIVPTAQIEAMLATLNVRMEKLQTLLIGHDTAVDSKEARDPLHFPGYGEKRYLNALIKQCSGLDLTLLDDADAGSDTLQIATVFTMLHLSRIKWSADDNSPDIAGAKSVSVKEIDKINQEINRSLFNKGIAETAVEGVAAFRRLVILGEPGGGKSTLVNHIATQLARRRGGDKEAALPGWPDDETPLPVRIVLRRFAAWLAREGRSGTAGDVWDYLVHLLQQWGCADSYHGLRHALIEEGGIVFFDGLDEIRTGTARRTVIRGAVADFAATETKCRVVVTSRPYAYTLAAGWRLPDDQFAEVSLAPFVEAQIEAFCRAWYVRHVQPRKGWDKAQCASRAGRLAQTIIARPHLRRLAASPLLLTLIAQVDSSGQEAMLPHNRADLYQRMVRLLLARWDNRVRLDSRPGDDVPADEILWLERVPAQEVHDVLAELAYKGHAEQGKQAAASDDDGETPAVEIAASDLKLALIEQFDSGRKAEDIITYIQHRAGLLVDKGEGVFTFPHRTYQEFLAAQHLLKQSDGLIQLCAHVKEQPDWWREVFLLSAGSSVSVPRHVQDLINALLPFDPGKAEMPLTADVADWAAIAQQALVETNFTYHVEKEKTPGGFTAVYRRVQDWLKVAMVADDLISATTRADAGRRLSILGDDRPGVGVDRETGLPDIVWSKIEIPAGTYTIGGDKDAIGGFHEREVEIPWPYRLTRYPITNAQFQCFVDAIQTNPDPTLWTGLPDNEQKFSNPRSSYANHPRDRVSWYQTLAFCRWLTVQLHAGALRAPQLEGDPRQHTITLPHEYEWEVAARWPNENVQQRIYPWGPEWDETKVNTSESGVGQVTAVGIYPSGRNASLELYDLSGNVWEYCRNRYEEPDGDMDLDKLDVSSPRRVLRGGSFGDGQYSARLVSRLDGNYVFRGDGFRVMVVRRFSISS